MPNNIRDDLLQVFEAISKAQLNTLRRLRRSAKQEGRSGSEKAPKSMSQVDMVYDILRSAGRPLHVTEIVTRVAKRFEVSLDRESIVSALAKRIARKDRFVRTAPNTFFVLPDKEG
ncbi:MAG TPA: HTH domain-containing protein [Candidatus Dormibacteraeota bacterium]|nr:HTH domain-containing protein [Candidatus Dormibacteraeota bacterium]